MNPTLTAQGHTHVRSQVSAAKGKAAFSSEACREEEGPATTLANPCTSTCRVAQLSLSLIGGLQKFPMGCHARNAGVRSLGA
jgi:hypothetical protein